MMFLISQEIFPYCKAMLKKDDKVFTKFLFLHFLHIRKCIGLNRKKESKESITLRLLYSTNKSSNKGVTEQDYFIVKANSCNV